MPLLNCLIVDDDALSRTIMEDYVGRHGSLSLVASCDSAVSAANTLQTHAVDLLFLDVEMPEMSGLELIGSLTQMPHVILVTSKQQYAVEAFDVDVVDYLLKPVGYPRFLKAVERVLRLVAPPSSGSAEDHVFIKSDGRLIKLALADVRWIEAQKDYVMFHTADRQYLVHGTMKKTAANLPSRAFVRVHRSFIVRLDQIKDIEDSTLVIGRQVIPIGASFREGLLQQLKLL